MDNPLVVNLLYKLHLLSIAHKTIFFCWIPSHIGIRGNEAADVAAKESLDFNITPSQVPYADLKPHINSFIANKWQERWSSCPDNIFFKLSPPLVCGHLVLEILVRRKLFYLGWGLAILILHIHTFYVKKILLNAQHVRRSTLPDTFNAQHVRRSTLSVTF